MADLPPSALGPGEASQVDTQPVPSVPMSSFRPQALRGAPVAGQPINGEINYRILRNNIITEFKKGRLAQNEVCDAHPELIRAARNVGEETSVECPICEENNVVLVTYVFGGHLPPGGTLITNKAELSKVAKRAKEMVCYVIEVCPSCQWNHLAQVLPLGGTRVK